MDNPTLDYLDKRRRALICAGKRLPGHAQELEFVEFCLRLAETTWYEYIGRRPSTLPRGRHRDGRRSAGRE